MSRIGILGGSFNPPHLGHLALAAAALEQLQLDRVLLMPVGEAPHKLIEPEPGREVRFELCSTACEGRPGIEVSRLELDRPGPSYTVDTLREIGRSNADSELFLILGEDMAASLGSWQAPDELVRLARIAWVPRDSAAVAPDGAGERIARLVEGLGGASPVMLGMEPVDVSSTLVRERCASGQGLEGLVPDAVAAAIGRLALYGERAAA